MFLIRVQVNFKTQTGRVQYDEARTFENETIHTSNNWKLVKA